jgi:hypothetical protein
MKALILFCSFNLLCLVNILAQNVDNAHEGAVIKVIGESSYNLKDVPVNTELSHKFIFINDGNAPLILKEVMSTRTNAIAEWTKSPILPGNKGVIIVYTYTKDIKGAFKNIFYVRSNAENSNCSLGYELDIKGYVNLSTAAITHND